MQHSQAMTAGSAKSGNFSQDKSHELSGLLQGTEQMLERAQHNDWAAVAKLELDRKTMLAAFFRDDYDSGLVELPETILKLLQLNNQIVKLIQTAKSETLTEQLELENGKQAIGNYLQCMERL